MLRETYKPAPERSLRRLILRGIGVHLYRHPFLAIVALAALTTATLWRIDEVEVSTSLRTALPMPPRDSAAWESAQIAALRHTPVIAAIQIPESVPETARADIARAFIEAWSDPAWLASIEEFPVDAPTGRIGYEEQLLLLRRRDLSELAALESNAGIIGLFYQAWGAPDQITTDTLPLARRDPTGVFTQLENRHRMSLSESAVVRMAVAPARPGPRTIVMRLNPVRPAAELLYSIRLRQFIESTIEAIRSTATPPLHHKATMPYISTAEVELTGPHIETAEMAANFAEEFVWLIGVLAVCLILLAILAFRKAEAIFFLALPATVGLAWTYGLMGWFHPRVTLLTAVLPVLLLGLAWEFSLQIYHRFTEELYRNRRYYPALATAYTEAGRGIFVATLATALMFATLLFSRTDILREWAITGVAGSVAMSLAALLVPPILASVKSMLAHEEVWPIETYDFGLKQSSAAVISSPRTTLVLALILTAWLTGYARDLKIDRDIGLDLVGGGQTIPSSTTDDAPQRSARAADPTLSILVEAPALQEALERNDRLYDNLLALPGRLQPLAIRSIASDLPSLATQREARETLQRLDPADIEPALGILALRLGWKRDAFAPALANLIGLRKAALTAPLLDIETNAHERLVALAQTRIGKRGQKYFVRTSLLPRSGTTSSQGAFANFRRMVLAGIPGAAVRFDSETIENRRMAYEVIYSLALSALLAIAVLVLVVLPHFHGRLGDTLLALLPLACAGVWTFGALPAIGRRIGLYSLLLFPLVSGIVVSQAVLLIQRLYDRQYASLRQVMRQGGRPGIISGAGLLLGLGCLNPLSFPALREMTAVALLAVAFAVTTTLVFVPAILEIKRQGGLEAWTNDGEETATPDEMNEE